MNLGRPPAVRAMSRGDGDNAPVADRQPPRTESAPAADRADQAERDFDRNQRDRRQGYRDGQPGTRPSGNRAAGTTNHRGTKAEKVKGSETRRCATVNFGTDVTDSPPATKGHVR